ncbi:ankyrin repeat-containing domain protein [Mycena amicta]|nr:ankyrin repeat-containing domain protein [Mycena amicta]
MSATIGVESQSSTLQISEIRISCTKPTKLRAVVSAKIASTDRAKEVGEAESKDTELELAVRIPPSSAAFNAKLFSILVYQQHRWLPDEQLLKQEISVETLLKYCSGQSESKVYKIFHSAKSGITISAELLETKTEAADPEPPQVPATPKKPDTVEGTDRTDTVLSNLLAALEIVQQVGSIVESVPFIAPIGAILSEFVGVYKEVKDNHGKRDGLLEKVAVLARDIGGAILLLNTSGNMEGIGRLKSDLEEYMGLLEEARKLTIASDEHGRFIRILKREELGGELDSLDKKLDFFGTRFRSNRLVDIQIEQKQVGDNVASILDAARDSKLEEERAKIIDWLSPINFFQRQADISRLRQEGTGDWLLEDTRFAEWKADSGGTLWCRGMPGVGKTVLVSIVVDHLKTQFPSAGVACIYLNHKETEIQTPSNLLASLWRQLVFGKIISAQSRVRQIFQQHSEMHTSPSLGEIQEVLRSVVAEWSKVYIVVDALDEYPEDERTVLLKHLTTIHPTVSLLLTSRPSINLDVSPPHLSTLEIRASDEDIRKYLEEQIQRSSRLSLHVKNRPELRDEITTKIQGIADGMFLLARLQIESLATKTSIKALREALQNLPKDLTKTYDEVMGRINEQNDDDKKLALAALSWVANAKRLLTVAELREALAVEPGAKSLDPDNYSDIGIILSACAGLLVVEPKAAADRKFFLDGEESPTVRLVHYTAQRYLESLFPDAHTEITRVLLTYLTFDELYGESNFYGQDEISLYLKGIPRALLRYCPYCLLHAVGQPEALLRDLIVEFLERAFKWNSLWRAYAAPPWSFHNWGMLQTPALWVAASANLQEIAKYLLDRGASTSDMAIAGTTPLYVASYYEVDATSGYKYNSALQAAAARGHIEVVQLLLDKGTTIDGDEGSYGNALQAAALAGHTEVVQFLINSGATVDWAKGDYGNALQAAAHEGHTKIVQILLDKGANVDMAGGGYGTALQVAALNGHTEIVESLLHNGANVNWAGGDSKSALQVASQQGHAEIVQLLLDKGADIDAETSGYGNALYAAAEQGHTEIIRLLLDNGANVDCAAEDYNQPLYAAAAQGHLDIFQMLLDGGGDVDIAGRRYRSVLQAAVEHGHLGIVQVILKKDTSVALGSSIYLEPLHSAAANGYTEIVQILLENGADVNAVGSDGLSPLQVASQNAHHDVVELLLRSGGHGDT